MMILLGLKLKDMSKYISDMTYKYINPETGTPIVLNDIYFNTSVFFVYKIN